MLLVGVWDGGRGLEEVRGLLRDGGGGGHGEGGRGWREVGRLELSHDGLGDTCALYCHYQH